VLPAARIGDNTAHGGVVTTGFPTVLIGSRPAARITDMHTCPLSTGPVPHVGGPIILGAFTVLTGNMPQARVTDTAICVGPPDMIAVGEFTVLVGMAGGAGLGGLLAGLAMAIGALFNPPYPRAVQRPDGTVVTEYNEFITIEGSPEYQATVVRDLDTFLSTKTGGKWQERYKKTGKKLTIRPIRSGENHGNAYAAPTSRHALMKKNKKPGRGSDSRIYYNPSLTLQYTATDGKSYPMEPNEVLAHELIHGLHNAEGTNMRNFKDPKDPSDNLEEAQTIGTHGYEKEPISERALMAEKGQPGRPNHNAVNDMTYRDESGKWVRVYRDSSGKWHRVPGKPGPNQAWRPSR